MTGPLDYRRARPQDIARIRELEIEAFGFTWDESTFLKEFERSDCLFVVGEDPSGIVVASASLNWVVDEIHLLAIVLDPAWRGRGLSVGLLGRCLAWCQIHQLGSMTLEVKWDNEPALKLYSRFGFTTVGKRTKYYRDGSDARIMWTGTLSSDRELRRLEPYRESASQCFGPLSTKETL